MAQIMVSGRSAIRKDQQRTHDIMRARRVAVSRRREEMEAAPPTEPLAAATRRKVVHRTRPEDDPRKVVHRSRPEDDPRKVVHRSRPVDGPMFDEEGRGLDVTGERIPMQSDEWQARHQAEIFRRREETKAGLRDIETLRDQAGLDRERADLSERQSELLGGLAEQALEEAGLATDRAALETDRAGHARDRAGIATDRAGHLRDRAGIATDRGTQARDRAGHARERADLERDRGTLATDRAAHERDRATLSTDRAAHTRDRSAHTTDRANLLRDKQQDLTALEEHTTTRAGEAARTAGVEADLVLADSVLAAADQERIAQIAAINVETLVAERAHALKDVGRIKEQTAAAVDERQAQIEMIGVAAAEAMQDTRLAAAQADAEAAVMSAARGAGGQVLQQQAASRQGATQRQLGRIGTKERLQKGQVESQIKGIRARGNMAKRRAVLAHFKAHKAIRREWKRGEAAEERKAHIEKVGQTRHDEIERAGALESEGLEIRATMIGREAEAAGISAKGLDIEAEGLELAAQGLDVGAAGHELAAKGMEADAQGHEVAARGLEVAARGMEVEAEGHDVDAEGLEVAARGADVDAAGLELDAQAFELAAEGIEVSAGRLNLQAASYELQASGSLLDAKAMRTNADMAERTADEGLQSLADRPPIPDWNAYGRKADRTERVSRVGEVIRTIGTVVGTVGTFF